MNPLHKLTPLPGVGTGEEIFPSSIVDSTASFEVTSASRKITEVVTTTSSTFGSDIPFEKLGATMPTIQELTASAMLNGPVAGVEGMTDAEIANELTRLSSRATASQIKDQTGSKGVTTDHLVTLSDGTIVVQFEVLPEIVEAHTNQYEAVAPAQFPGAFQKYKGSDSTQWTLNITLISRTPAEADKNYGILNTLRGWKQPFFGQTTGNQYPKMLGAPPPVLILKGLRNLIGPVPVVITTLNWNWPKDVDYLPTLQKGSDSNYIPFPAVMNLAIQLVESYSTKQFNQFDLRAYRAGKMVEAFNGDNFPIYGAEGE